MKKAIYSAIAILLSFYSISQTFWTEAFENSCTANCSANGSNTGNGAWTVSNNSPAFDGCGYATSPNAWYISCAENGNAAGVCGVGCGSDESLHVGSTTVGDLGAAYDAGGWCDFGLGGWGEGTPTDIRAESPTINCSAYSNITIAFNYIENGDATLDDASLWWYNGTVWAQLTNMAKTTLCGGQGMWTAYSTTLPAGANNNANVKIGFRWVNNDDGFGTDPSFAVDDITLAVVAVSNTITTGTITGSPFCACASVNVPFTSTGTFIAGNTYTAQLSDASGSFTSPVAIGTLSSTANSGTISCVIPCNTATGTLYRIRVISSTPSITGTDNGVNITINAAPTTPVIGTITQPTCSTSTGSVDLSGLPASGSWTVTANPGGATTTGSGTTTTFAGLTAGSTYTFTVTNASGCTSSSSGNAIINIAPTTPSAPVVGSITQPSCSTTTGSVALSGLPASGSWTITASPGGTTATGSGTTTSFSGLTAGTTYSFTVTNSSGCTSTSSTNAIINSAPSNPTSLVIGTITQPTCSIPTGSVDLSGLPASGTWTITASPGGATATGTGTTTTFTGLTAGTTYTFTVTNSSGCTSPASANAAITSSPSSPGSPVIGTITQPTCSVSTGSVELSGLPSSGTWTVTANPGGTTSNGTGTTTTFSGLSAGTTFTFTVANDLGCISSSSSNVVINSAPTTPSAPIIGAITQPTCTSPTGSVALSGLPASGTWTITASPGGTTTTGTGTNSTFTGLAAATTYTFTVSNASGCFSASSANAVINSVPSAPSIPTASVTSQPTCLTPTGTITVTAPTGANIQYSVGGTYQASGIFSGLAANTYNVTAQDISSGCISPATVLIINAPPGAPTAPTASVTTQPTCTTPSGTITVTAPTGANIQYSVGGAYQVSGTFSGLVPGNYNITAQDISTGCTSTATVLTVNVIPTGPMAPTATVSTQPTCTTPTGTIVITAPTGANIQYSVGGVYQTSGTFSGLSPNDYNVTAQDITTGCTSSITILTVNAAPTPPAAPTASVSVQPTCSVPTGTIEVTAPTGANYTYSIGATYQSSTTFSGLVPNDYNITVQDISTGCISTATVLTVNPAAGSPTITVTGQADVSCFGENDGLASISVSGGTAPYVYSWSPSGGSSDVAINLQTGTYTVTVTDDDGCSTSEDIVIGSPSEIIIGGIETDVQCGVAAGSITTNVSGGSGIYTLEWNDNSSGTSLSDLIAGNYSVVVTDDSGCSITESYTISNSGSLTVNVTPATSIIYAGETVQLNASGGTDYTWTPGTGLSCTECPDPIASPNITTIYTVDISDSFGCSESSSALITVLYDCGEIFVPTIFSPNNDLNNDKLEVFGLENCVTDYHFTVYDRWGELVFETTETTVFWDGTYKGKLMNSGTYFYKLEATLINLSTIDTTDPKIMLSGNTALVR